MSSNRKCQPEPGDIGRIRGWKNRKHKVHTSKYFLAIRKTLLDEFQMPSSFFGSFFRHNGTLFFYSQCFEYIGLSLQGLLVIRFETA